MNQRRFVVLDRDGTIIEERHYLSDPDQIKLIPGAAGALRALKKLGLGLVVVTNQSAVGRGFFSEARLTEIHRRLLQMLAAENVEVDGVYFCPHVPDDRCLCRKPQVGMVQKAAQELSFDLDRLWSLVTRQATLKWAGGWEQQPFLCAGYRGPIGAALRAIMWWMTWREPRQ